MADGTKGLPAHVDAEVQRILDSAARRILNERQAVLEALVVTYWRNGKQVG